MDLAEPMTGTTVPDGPIPTPAYVLAPCTVDMPVAAIAGMLCTESICLQFGHELSLFMCVPHYPAVYSPGTEPISAQRCRWTRW
ncbi:hypothetical protein NSK11_contig00210-0012 [Nocardia seriolae]|uniref:Uncharacterized protein n=1 Tax=Nocardia seriolae TaxID=37332 RepID=A0ABC9Z7P1_9NOCA|nr:conserved hypothetical protein [Nocardia seriolae]GEM28724.1 hypothetical protein NS2_69630 [Nocardia seriolae NBRC 15557]BEK90484.1 hypothetical protein NSERKGN1266_64350 [Nocardia seriolae]BEK93691.1 hypothetical protein NSER024013_15970 [Nocardia seriolae]GAM51150.1 hypothetical protein NS07_v2contig00208-0012 [Nocardia seriolae]